MERRFIVNQETEHRKGGENDEDKEVGVSCRDYKSFSENTEGFKLRIFHDKVAFHLHAFTSKLDPITIESF